MVTNVLSRRLPSASDEERSRVLGTWGDGGRLRWLFVALAVVLAIAAAGGLAGCGAQGGASGATQSAATTEDGGKVKVVASFYPMADFATKVGGDHVEGTNLVPAGTEPHEWEPSPTDVTKIKDADLLVYNGASMEGWVDDTLASLGNDAPATVVASDGIQLRAGDEHEESGEGEAHEHEYDPHVWLAPENAKHEMENIKNALVKVDPEHKDDYEANFEKYASQFDELDNDYRTKLSAVPNKTVVVSHEAFGYLCDAYGLNQVAIAGMDAEGEPDAQTMASIIDQVKAQNIKVIFSEDLVSPKVSQQIADATGATCEVLKPVEGLTDEQLSAGEDYFSVMKANLDELVAALS